MTKTILITGSTDGIGFETAKRLASKGHRLLIHGRSAAKLSDTQQSLSQGQSTSTIEAYLADLSNIPDVEAMAGEIAEKHGTLDVIINNAGVYKASNPQTPEGFDIRFMVNTIAPYILTKKLLPLLPEQGRVINLSSAAQSPVNLDALAGKIQLNDSEAYAESKLAITQWSFHLAQSLGENGPVIVAVNPASFLGSKMVKDAYGVSGNDLGIGADILVRAALSDEFADASGQYFDNDQRRFARPHPDALNGSKNQALIAAMESVISKAQMGNSQ